MLKNVNLLYLYSYKNKVVTKDNLEYIILDDEGKRFKLFNIDEKIYEYLDMHFVVNNFEYSYSKLSSHVHKFNPFMIDEILPSEQENKLEFICEVDEIKYKICSCPGHEEENKYYIVSLENPNTILLDLATLEEINDFLVDLAIVPF